MRFYIFAAKINILFHFSKEITFFILTTYWRVQLC